MRRQTVVGFLLGGLVLGAFLLTVGIEELFRALTTANTAWFVIAMLFALAGVGLQVEAIRVLIDDTQATSTAVRFAYLRSLVVRQLLPIGGAATPAIIAYSLRRTSGTSYEHGFVATVTSGTGSVIAGAAVGVIGITVLNPPVRALVQLSGVLALLFVVGVGFLLAVLLRPTAGEAVLVAGSKVARMTFGRISADVVAWTDHESVDRHARAYHLAVRSIRQRPWHVVASFTLSLLSWSLFALTLYACLRAIGITAPPALVFAIVPLGDLVRAIPTPGGIGGVEVVIAALLVLLTGTTPILAAAATVLYRLCTYWFVLAVTMVVATYLARRYSAPLPNA